MTFPELQSILLDFEQRGDGFVPHRVVMTAAVLLGWLESCGVAFTVKKVILSEKDGFIYFVGQPGTWFCIGDGVYRRENSDWDELGGVNLYAYWDKFKEME